MCQPESKFLPSLCPQYTFYLKNRVFGECGANIMSQILEKLRVNSLKVERGEERIRSDSETRAKWYWKLQFQDQKI